MHDRIHRGTTLSNQLEEVLDVFREAKLNDETLGPTEIAGVLGYIRKTQTGPILTGLEVEF